MRVSAIIAGAGKSLRFSSSSADSSESKKLHDSIPTHQVLEKQFRAFNNQPLIFFSLQTFLKSEIIQQIVLVVPQKDVNWIQEQVNQLHSPPPVPQNFCGIGVIAGGELRQESVQNGVEFVKKNSDIVVIHDAVRPFVQKKWIHQTVSLCKEGFDGAIVAVKTKDTLKMTEDSRSISSTLNRGTIWQAQTPQSFKVESLILAYHRAKKNNLIGTDEAQLVEESGGKVALVEGSALNIKITTAEDWLLAEKIKELWDTFRPAFGGLKTSLEG